MKRASTSFICLFFIEQAIIVLAQVDTLKGSQLNEEFVKRCLKEWKKQKYC
ncbi:MAG: hypothetical protein ACJAZY_002546 [Spirosomataceae bacterium]|jgi:hypothetical protein